MLTRPAKIRQQLVTRPDPTRGSIRPMNNSGRDNQTVTHYFQRFFLPTKAMKCEESDQKCLINKINSMKNHTIYICKLQNHSSNVYHKRSTDNYVWPWNCNMHFTTTSKSRRVRRSDMYKVQQKFLNQGHSNAQYSGAPRGNKNPMG